jgi:malonyl CoA-acyl carrier protein transacylase
MMARHLVDRHPWARQLVSDADRWLAEVGAEPVAGRIFRPLDRAADRREVDAWASDLARTEGAQPALCLASLISLRHLEELGLRPSVVAGHSLGELSALHAGGAFGAEALIKLAALRG